MTMTPFATIIEIMEWAESLNQKVMHPVSVLRVAESSLPINAKGNTDACATTICAWKGDNFNFNLSGKQFTKGYPITQ